MQGLEVACRRWRRGAGDREGVQGLRKGRRGWGRSAGGSRGHAQPGVGVPGVADLAAQRCGPRPGLGRGFGVSSRRCEAQPRKFFRAASQAPLCALGIFKMPFPAVADGVPGSRGYPAALPPPAGCGGAGWG